MRRVSFKLQPDFARIRKVLSLQVPDRVPMAELTVDKPVKEAFLGRQIETISDEVDFWYRAGYDFAWIRAGYNIDDLFVGAYESGTGHAKPPIRNIEDFENYLWKSPDEVDFTIFDDATNCLPEGMGIISGEGGFFSFSWMLMGMENFCLEAMDKDGLSSKVVRKVSRTLIEVNRKAASHPSVGAIWVGDDLAYGAGLMMSPDWFREHIFPYYIELGEICRQYDKPLIFHSDGDYNPLIDDLVKAGVNAIHPLEPGSMDIVEIKRQWGDKIALIGNVDLVHTLPYGTKDEIYAEVRDRIHKVGFNGGYIVSSANSIPANIPLENYITMINAVYDCGKYPIG